MLVYIGIVDPDRHSVKLKHGCHVCFIYELEGYSTFSRWLSIFTQKAQNAAVV